MSQYIISKSLQKDIDYIKTRTENVKKNIFEIAWRLHMIVQSPDFADSGYLNITDLAAEHFGYSRSTTLNYIAIANKYLTTTQADGKTLTTTCARIDENGKVTADYAIGQLNALGKTTSDDFITMDSEGVITPEMSADKIKQAVKQWYNPDPEPAPEPDPEPDQEPDPEPEPEQNDEPTFTLTLRELVSAIFRDVIGDDSDICVECALEEALFNATRGRYSADIQHKNDHGDIIIDTVEIEDAETDMVCMTYPEKLDDNE